jgi:hypothetical protein
MSREVLAAAEDGRTSFDTVLSAAGQDRPGEPRLDGLVRQVLRAMLEERRTRQPAGDAPAARGEP